MAERAPLLRPQPPAPVINSTRPDPDPTVRTTEALLREVANQSEIFDGKIRLVESVIEGIKSTFNARLAANDQAVNLLQAARDKFPDHVVNAITQLQSLHQEKFNSVEKQIAQLDALYEKVSQAAKEAINAAMQAAEKAIAAALQAQKESVDSQNKSNALSITEIKATFSKQIEQESDLNRTRHKSTDDKVDDLKSRVQAIEGQRKGGVEVWSFFVAGFGMLVAVASVVVAVALKR